MCTCYIYIQIEYIYVYNTFFSFSNISGFGEKKKKKKLEQPLRMTHFFCQLCVLSSFAIATKLNLPPLASLALAVENRNGDLIPSQFRLESVLQSLVWVTISTSGTPQQRVCSVREAAPGSLKTPIPAPLSTTLLALGTKLHKGFSPILLIFCLTMELKVRAALS